MTKVKYLTLELLQIILSRCVGLIEFLRKRYKEEEIEAWLDIMIRLLPDVTAVIAIRQMAISKAPTSINVSMELDNSITEHSVVEKGRLCLF